MKIACLGWGSLVWDPRDLPLQSEWRSDGPLLPLEFTRQSDNGRITLVITEGASPVTTLWCELVAATLNEAVAKLADREGIKSKNAARLIGRWSADDPKLGETPASICDWAQSKQLNAVVWTALLPKFSGSANVPTCAQVVEYLKSTTGGVRSDSERYVRNAPAQITTTYRTSIEQHLGWTRS